MCQGFLLNRKLIPHTKKFLLGIHAQSTLSKEPIEVHKLWKRIFFRILYPINMHYIKKSDEIRIQNKDDERRLHEIGFKGKIWNVPPSMFDTTPEPIETNEFSVIWFNRVSPEKRPEKLVEIAQHLQDVKFYAIGSGPLSYMFKNIPNIEYLGFLPEDKLSDMLRKASLCIMTSRGENFGMSAVEAQAYGVPTLSYDVMGLRDYNETVKDITEMVKRINDHKTEFLNNKEGYMQKRQMLREHELERFSNKTVIPQVKDMMIK